MRRLLLLEEFKYPNTRKLSSPYSGNYNVLKIIYEVNYEVDRTNNLTKKYPKLSMQLD